MKESRDLKVTFNKGGSGSMSSRITLPISWIRDHLGITPEKRDVEVTLEDDKIIIKKK